MSKKQEKEQINLFKNFISSKLLTNPSLSDNQLYKMAKINGIKISKQKAFKIIHRLKSKYKKEHKISKTKTRKSKFQNYAENKIKTNPGISANKIINDAKKLNISIRRQEALKIIKEYKKKYKGYKKVKKKKEIKTWTIPEKIPKEHYFGKLKVEFYDNFGEYNEWWLTTKDYPNIKYAQKEMDLLERDINIRYDINVIRFIEIYYQRKRNHAERLYQQVYRPR